MAEEEDELMNEIAALPHAASPAGQMILRLHRHLKKPTIEAPLAEEMLTYLNYLRESQVFLNNGIMNFSFAEGALLIQIAAQLYSRKVDMLWKSVIEYHEHMANYEEPTEDNAREMERIQERKNRYTRKKRVPEVPPEGAENLPQPLVLNGQQAPRQYPPQTPENQVQPPVEEPPQQQQLQANDEASALLAQTLQQEEINMNLPLPEVIPEPVPVDPEIQIKQEMQEYIDKAYSMCPKEVHANLFQNLANLVYDVIVLDDDNTIVLTSTPRKTVDSHSDVESGFFDHSDIESVIPSGDNRTTPITPMIFSPVPDEYYAEDRTAVDYPEVEEEEQNTSEEQTAEMESPPPNDSGIIADNDTTVEEVVSKACRKRISVPSFAASTPKRRKVQNKKSLTVNLKSFESFFSKTYQAESGEGDPPPFEDDSDSVSDCDIFVIDDDDDVDDGDGHEALEVTIKEEPSDEAQPAPAPIECAEQQPNATDEKNDDLKCMKINFDLRIAELEKARLEQNKLLQEEARTAKEQAKNYQEWTEFIKEKIGNEHEIDFDIHSEGSKIIESIGGVGEVKKFSELADGKSPRDVCCSFIAMLELVNKSNVELEGTNPGGLANDTLSLKLVSKDRHHESLLGYNAPSELSYRENLANVARSRFQFQHTRPIDMPSTSTGYQAKRPRY